MQFNDMKVFMLKDKSYHNAAKPIHSLPYSNHQLQSIFKLYGLEVEHLHLSVVYLLQTLIEDPHG